MNPCFCFMDDLCSSLSTTILVICSIYLVCKGIKLAIEFHESNQAEEAKAKKAREEAEFQQKHPELWRQRELLKLEQERLEAEKKLAQERADREVTAQKAGLIFGIGRGLGWW